MAYLDTTGAAFRPAATALTRQRGVMRPNRDVGLGAGGFSPVPVSPDGVGGMPMANPGTVMTDPAVEQTGALGGDLGMPQNERFPEPGPKPMPKPITAGAVQQTDPAVDPSFAQMGGGLGAADQPGGTSAFGGVRSRMAAPMGGAMSDLDRRRRMLMAGGAAGGGGAFGVGPRFADVGLDSGVGNIRSQLRRTSPVQDTLNNLPRNFDPRHPEPLSPSGTDPFLVGGVTPFTGKPRINTLQPPKASAITPDPSAQPSPAAPMQSDPANEGALIDYNNGAGPAFNRGGRVLRDANGGRVRRGVVDPADVGLGVPGKSRGAASGNSGSVIALADGGPAQMEQFHYDPSKPIETQIREFLAGRNPYGEMKDPNWFKDPALYQQYSNPDESGTANYGYRALDPRLADVSPGAAGPEWTTRLVDGKYTPVNWAPSSHADAINGLKPDSMYDYGQMYYDPRFGLVMPGTNARDPDAKHDAWYGAGMMAAVAGPAIAGIMGGAGAGAGVAGDESAGLSMAPGGGGGAGIGADESAGLSMAPGGGTGAGIGADESAGLTLHPGEAPGIGADESAGLSMNPGEGSGVGADESAGLNMDPPDYGIDTTRINPVELQQNPQIQEMAQRQGMSVTDWLKDPRNLQTAARALGSLAGLATGGSGRGASSLVPEPGTGDGTAPGPGAGAPGSSVDVRGTVVDPESITSKLFNTIPQAGGGAGNWSGQRGQVQPLQDMLFGEAMKAGSPEEQEAAAGRAGADVKQSFEANRQKRRSDLIAQGINPDTASGVGSEMDRLSALDEAKATTSGKNLARLSERNKGFSERAAAIGLGNTAAAQGLQADQIAATTGLGNARIASDTALGGARINADLTNANAGRTNQQYLQGQQLGYQDKWKTGDQAIDRARVNSGITAANNAARRQNAVDTGRGVSTVLGGLGSVYDFGSKAGWWRDGGRIDVGLGTAAKVTRGFRSGGRVTMKAKCFDDGGAVDGPGSSTSDSIRARLSDGEHVLNAEAVELMDASQPGALDELNQQGLKIRAVRHALRKQMNDVGLGA